MPSFSEQDEVDISLNTTKLGHCCADADRGRPVMASPVVVGFLDDVRVVAAAFDDTGVGSMSAACVAAFIDFGDGFGYCLCSMFRGKSPPAR